MALSKSRMEAISAGQDRGGSRRVQVARWLTATVCQDSTCPEFQGTCGRKKPRHERSPDASFRSRVCRVPVGCKEPARPPRRPIRVDVTNSDRGPSRARVDVRRVQRQSGWLTSTRTRDPASRPLGVAGSHGHPPERSPCGVQPRALVGDQIHRAAGLSSSCATEKAD